MLKDGKRKKILRRKKNIEEEDGLRKKISHKKFKRDFSLLHKAKVKEESAKRKGRAHAKAESKQWKCSFLHFFTVLIE